MRTGHIVLSSLGRWVTFRQNVTSQHHRGRYAARIILGDDSPDESPEPVLYPFIEVSQIDCGFLITYGSLSGGPAVGRYQTGYRRRVVKTRILLAAGAALSAAAAMALTVPTLAGATATPAAATAATHMVTAGRLAGAVRPARAGAAASRSAAVSSTGQATAGAAAASCSEPDCDLAYHGGPVQH